MTQISIAEWLQLNHGEFTILPYQKELFENPEEFKRMSEGVAIHSSMKSHKWTMSLSYMRACWELGFETMMVSMQQQSINRPYIIFDEIS